MENKYIRWLSELDKNSGMIAGGKGANLAEMYNAKFPVPPAFVITTKAYYAFIEKTGIRDKIYDILESIDVDNTAELEEKAKEIREIIVRAEMPEDIAEEIIDAYSDLSVDKRSLSIASKDALSILRHAHDPVFVAVRSSATTEDLAESSFAGQQDTYLNVKGNRELIENAKKVLASLFTARAVYYRKKRGFAKEKFALAVVVQKMIDADKSGVMFSKNPVRNTDNVVIEGVFGLGEGIVSGKINPDTYEVSRDLEIVSRKIGEKKTAITRDSNGNTVQVKLTPEKSREQVLNESQIISLANIGLRIEAHYGKPQDIEFALEGTEIYIVQSRPITTSTKEPSDDSQIKGKEILSGLGASPGIGAGKVKIIHDISELSKVEKGDVLVTKMTNPDMVVSMQKADAIVTDEGGITSHAAIVSREMGIPAVVGTMTATKVLKDGDRVTVNGSTGKVYVGELEEKKIEVLPIVKTKLKIKVIVDVPEAAERAARTQCEAVGLLRLEGIIATGKKHPLQYRKDKNLNQYTMVIREGIEKIAKHFKEVWVRTSDIRTDEFQELQGAPTKVEGNPMLGDHGIRFSLRYPEILTAEMTAIKEVAMKNPNKILGIMFPQVISVEEVQKAKEMAKHIGLLDMKNIKFGIMVETPAAAFVIKDLVKTGLHFVSFGTNDLTQYVLAIDRNNPNVQNIFNESHPAVLNAIKRVLRTCQEEGVESSICGQAGSRKEMVKFLMENGITSVSVNADAAKDISEFVAELENNLPDITQNPQNKKQNRNEDENVENKVAKVKQNIESELQREIPEIIKEKMNSQKQQNNNQKQNQNQKNNNQNNQGKKERYDVPAYIASALDVKDKNEREVLRRMFDYFPTEIKNAKTPEEFKGINNKNNAKAEVNADF